MIGSCAIFSNMIRTLVCVAGATGVLLAQDPTRLITETIDEHKLVTLPGNTRPETVLGFDLGGAAAGFAMPHMLLQLRRPQAKERALQNLISELHTAGSSKFHRWLSAQEFGTAYGLATEDLESVAGWLRSHGLTVNCIYPNGTLIDFGGTASQVAAALRTEIHWLNIGGSRHFANMSDPRVPTAIAPAVAGIIGLHNFSAQSVEKTSPHYTFGDLYGSYHAVAPADLATIYNLGPLFNSGISGQGQTIAVIETSDLYSDADWLAYRSAFGLSGYAFGKLLTVHPAPPSGASNCNDPGGTTFLTVSPAMDTEIASAAAPSATIELASCGDSDTGILIAVQNLLAII